MASGLSGVVNIEALGWDRRRVGGETRQRDGVGVGSATYDGQCRRSRVAKERRSGGEGAEEPVARGREVDEGGRSC
jgi:hypothetical protein